MITVNKYSKEWNKVYTVQNGCIFKIRNISRLRYIRTNQPPPSQAVSVANNLSMVYSSRDLEQMENEYFRKPLVTFVYRNNNNIYIAE